MEGWFLKSVPLARLLCVPAKVASCRLQEPIVAIHAQFERQEFCTCGGQLHCASGQETPHRFVGARPTRQVSISSLYVAPSRDPFLQILPARAGKRLAKRPYVVCSRVDHLVRQQGW
jgi:hypothetical protein